MTYNENKFHIQREEYICINKPKFNYIVSNSKSQQMKKLKNEKLKNLSNLKQI